VDRFSRSTNQTFRSQQSIPAVVVYLLRCYRIRVEEPKVHSCPLFPISVKKFGRVIEGVFEKLVEWAAAALETSSNQPVLPHAIIALNASENNIDPELWDTDVATEHLLESLSQTVRQNRCFKKHAQIWASRNKQIETVEQLMLSYYSSLRVSVYMLSFLNALCYS
jgi:hypothetical protein